MSDLHRNSRFLRFLRSICAKTACARRVIVALFVAVATILATFMIMPSASMGASQQGATKQTQTQAEKTESNTAADNKVATQGEAAAKGGADAQGDAGYSKTKESNTAESKNPQPSANSGASNSSHTKNVDSEKKQGAAKEDANKNPNQDAKKDAEKDESAKRSPSKKRSVKEENRAANGSDEPPAECKQVDSLAKCYKVKYEPQFNSNKDKKKVISVRGQKFSVEPTFNYAKVMSRNVIYKGFVTGFEPEKLMVSKSEEAENKGLVTVDSTTGKITVYANKWLKGSNYYAYVKVMYSDGSYTTNFKCPTTDKKCVKSTVRLSFSVARIEDEPGNLSLKVYDNKDSTTGKEVKDNGIAATVESDKDGKFSPITPLFIDTKSANKPNPIYHRMICHKDGNSSDYYLDSINGLTLSDSADGGNKVSTQKQWDYALGDRPTEKSAKASTVYENDPFAERSQSWITGTPNETGDFTCKVFAFNDADFYPMKTSVGSYVNLFKSNITDNDKLKSIFENPWKAFYTAGGGEGQRVSEDKYEDSLSNQKTIDWDVKTIKIVFESKNKHLEVKDGDLKLNVYPFKNNDAGSGKPGASASSALADGGTVSAMLGMELKPFIEATSVADSQKAITLKMLCSKGEEPQKTNSGDAGGTSNSDGTSNGVAAGGSGTTGNTDNKGLVYTKWEEPSKLGFTFPDENAQKPCTSKKDKQTCSLEGSTKNFAATTNVSATFKSAEAGDYQCVVYALKPDALTKFNEEAAKTGVTPEKISTTFAGAKLTANKNLAKLTINIHVPEKFTLPHTGEWNWNLQLGAVAAVMVSVLAAGFVASQTEACRKLLYERRRC